MKGNKLMKTTTNIIYSAVALFAFACFALAPAIDAQCPQICDSNDNTAVGNSALISNTTGSENTALGADALLNSTIGFNNTAVGYLALEDNIIGSFNTAVGASALSFNTTGSNNTASGDAALETNTTGSSNTATGRFALLLSRVGNYNTATGFSALISNEDSSSNTAIGAFALFHSRTGNNNTAIGYFALGHNKTGRGNIALGFTAGSDLTTGSENIDIGNEGRGGESSTIRIGTTGTHTNTYVAGISGVTIPTGVAVIVDSSGHLGTATSSAQYKEAIKPMNRASEAILALKPVTFRYKQELDSQGIQQFGLVAEDVEKVNPVLVARDDQGKPYTVRYEAVNAMLLNEFLKEHRKVEEQDCKLQEQGAMIAHQQKQIEALTAGLQKVSAQLELSKLAPQTVNNP
jgi:hypothetical protein